MTAQQGDILKDREQTYTILRRLGEELFRPEAYGLHPISIHTACRRGYRCTYELRDSFLTLRELLVKDGLGVYPPINGVGIAGRGAASPLPSDFESMPDPRPRLPSGPETYKDIDLPIPYTGKLLLADDFDFRYYIHMGLQRPHGFRKLYTYSFQDGKLIEITDHCETASMLRELCDQNSDPELPWLRGGAPYDKLPEELRKTIWWL